MYKVEGIYKQAIECEISANQVSYILQQEYSSILGCTFGSILYGELKRKGKLVVAKDNHVFKELTQEENDYANALEKVMEYFKIKEEKEI